MTATDAVDNPSYFAVAADDQSACPPPPQAPPPPPLPGAGAAKSEGKPLLKLLKRRPRTNLQPGATLSLNSGASRRLGFRSLLRSMSASSASLQQIAQGQPRPSDVAPPSPTLEALGPLASPGPVVSPGRLQEAASPHAGQEQGGRYYNVRPGPHPGHPGPHPAPHQGHPGQQGHPSRRHSIGTLHAGASSRPMDDIVLVWSGGGGGGGSSAASLWISYLQSCFQQICKKRNRPTFRTADVAVQQLVEAGGSERWGPRLLRAKLVILVVCPAMLSALAALSAPLAHLEEDRTLVMLLGVSEEELQPEQRAVLGGGCRRMVVRDQDAAFVGDFLAVAMNMLVRTWRARAARAARGARKDPATRNAPFSVSPKKVKQGQSKVLVLLAEPLQPGDAVEVVVDKDDNPTSVPVRRRNPYTLQFSMPDSLLDVSALVSVSVTLNGQLLGTREVKCESKLRELDRILRGNDNPFQFLCQTLGFGPADRDGLDNFLFNAFQKNVPPHFNVLHAPGYRPQANSSVDEFPTLLHFAAHFGLERLCVALVDSPGGEQACQLRNCDDLTPAELSERAGHPRLSTTLQGYMQMSELSNMYSLLKTMSERRTEFSDEGNYLTPRPASETYSVPPAPVPTPCEPPADASPVPADPIPASPVPEVSACPPASPSPLPPAACPEPTSPPPPAPSAAVPERSDSLPASTSAEAAECSEPRSAGASSEDEAFPLYTETHAAPLPLEHSGFGLSPARSPTLMHPYVDMHGANPSLLLYQNIGKQCSGSGSPTGSPTREAEPEGAQLELLEIISDFRNNASGIVEVEQLVESWRGRNHVQQSFRDKQEQLDKMREEYERVQNTMKRLTGKPSPFERIKRLFTRNKNKSEHKESRKAASRRRESTATTASSVGACSSVRPPSSLSRQSSCSSSWSARSSEGSDSPHQQQDHCHPRSSLEYDLPPSPRPLRVPVRISQVDSVSWLHPVSPASPSDHYVSPGCVRPVHPDLHSPSAFSASDTDLGEDGFPLDAVSFSSYVNVSLPSSPPPVPERTVQAQADCNAQVQRRS